MSRRYDTRTTVFSPQGRLFQIEYAMHAINHAGTCVGISYKDGILLGSEKRNIDKLLNSSHLEKIYKVSDNIFCSVAGVTSDATTLINRMRVISEKHFHTFQESITVEQLVVDICNIKQNYTQIGGYRPFGVSLLYAGWDSRRGFQLYQSDPSGNYSGWLATCLGKNNEDGVGILKADYRENMNLQQALALMAKILNKTIDKKPLTSEYIEMAYATMYDGKISYHVMSREEIDQMLLDYQNAEIESRTQSAH